MPPRKNKKTTTDLISRMNRAAYLYVRATFTENGQEKAKADLDKQIAKVFLAICGREPTLTDIDRCRGW